MGSWPDVRGILFGYDIDRRQIILADRGQGILKTLKRVKSDLANDRDALFVAFTEKISGRAPESRGNGLKHVKKLITKVINLDLIRLYFQSGNTNLTLTKNGDQDLNILISSQPFRGCLALINF